MPKKEKKVKKTTTVTTVTTEETINSYGELTHIINILDRSGSMRAIIDDAIGGFNEYINKQKILPGKATMTTALFDDYYEILHNNININDVNDITRDEWSPRGMTALNDAIGKTINSEILRLKVLPKKDQPNKVLVVVVTDGYENASKEFSGADIKSLIKTQEKNDWQFIYIGADQDALSVGSDLGVSGGNTLKYSNTSGGNKNMFSSLSDATSKYRSISTFDSNYSVEVGNLFDGKTDISDDKVNPINFSDPNIVMSVDPADGFDDNAIITFNDANGNPIYFSNTDEIDSSKITYDTNISVTNSSDVNIEIKDNDE